MKFSCESSALQRGISVVQNVAQSKIANPIVENILIVVTEGQVLFIGTNLNQTIRCVIEAETSQEGQVAVPGRYISNLVRELAGGTVRIELKRSKLHIRSGKGVYHLSVIPAEEFPPFLPLTKGEVVSFTSSEIKEIIRKTIFCTSTEKARFELDGVKIQGLENRIFCISTDGRRLSKLEIQRETSLDESMTALIPSRTWQELNRILPEGQEVQVTFGESKVMFEAGDITVLSSLLGDNFPPHEQIVPSSFLYQIVVLKQDLETAVRRACVLASESTHQVVMEVTKDEMTVKGESHELGDAKDSITVEYNGEPQKISYKGDYILDFLKSVTSEKVVIRINDAVSPAAYGELDYPGYTHIIMPMKINEDEMEQEEEESPE